MKEIVILLINKIFDKLDDCLVLIIAFGLFVLVPILIFLGTIIK